MNVMLIDFFFLRQKTETVRDEGFFQVEEEKEEKWCLAHASNIFSSFKKKQKKSGLAAVLGSSITPCCNKALILALDNVSVLCLCNTLNLAHLAFSGLQS